MHDIWKLYKKKREIVKEHIDTSLRKRLKIFYGISLIILCIALYKFFNGDISFSHIIIWYFIGLIVGFLAGRMYKIFWHEQEEKVVSQLDAIGIIILILFITIEIWKNWIFGHWIEASELNTFGLIFISGALMWRLLAMILVIKKILRRNNKI